MKIDHLSPKSLPSVVEIDGAGGSAAAPEAFFGRCLDRADDLRRRLLECGALLLRGCPPLTAPQFAQFVRALSGKEPLDYVAGASPRVKLGGGVYTSTEYPRESTLSLHNELSYTYRWPDHLYFCCVTPAAEGGETPLADSRAILRGIDRALVGEFKRRRIMYVRNLHGGAGTGYSWQEAFETGDRRAVEDYCRAGGVAFEWKGDGGLILREVRPATARHPLTGEEVWFNQAEGFHPGAAGVGAGGPPGSRPAEAEFRLNSYYGDGAPLDPAALDHIREVTREESVLVSWRAGDILILDNLLAAHGRMPFAGPRKILLAMT